MAASETSIINSALVKLGQARIISPTQLGRAARTANEQYPKIRDALQRSYRWNFCMARTSLPAEADAPAFGFTYKFRKPTDAIDIVGIGDADGIEPLRNYTGSKNTWKIEGPFILAESNPLRVFYKRRVTDTGLFDPLFDEVLAIALAMDIGYDITAGSTNLTKLERDFDRQIRAAKLADAIEGTPEVVTSSEWLDARLQSTFFPPRIGPVAP